MFLKGLIGKSSPFSKIRVAIIEYFKQIIDLARDLSSNRTNLVIHAGNYPSFRNARGYENSFYNEHYHIYSKILCENITELIEYGTPDVQIVLENQSWDGLVREVLQQLLHKGLRLCLDIPKLFTQELEIKSEEGVGSDILIKLPVIVKEVPGGNDAN